MTLALDKTVLAWRQVSPATYRAMQRSLVDYGQRVGGQVFSDAELAADAPPPIDWQGWTPFTVLVTPTTQALLVQPAQGPSKPLGLTCDGGAIAQFLTTLVDILPPTHPWRPQLESLIHPLHSRPPALGTEELILALAPLWVGESGPSGPGEESPHLSAPRTSTDPDPLLHQVIHKVHQSLDLDTILATTVAEARQSLGVDRLVIYQFTPPLQVSPVAISALPWQGTVVHAALAPPWDGATIAPDWQRAEPLIIAAALDRMAAQAPLSPTLSPCWELALGPEVPCPSPLVSPIVIRDRLWGLLIAHQICTPRQWQTHHRAFLQPIAEHLGVAIYQAQLYQQLQDQTHSLEQCITTQTQDLQDALIAAQAANRTKSEFLATMSHELRTPLTCIIGMSATLLRWSFGDLTPRQRDYLTTIHESGERLLALINDILELAKIEAGRAVLEVAPVSLDTLAYQCWEAFYPEAQAHDIEMTYDLDALGGQDEFVGDARRICQILSNLLSNALKFTAAGGQVNLRVRREHQTAVFHIEDTGIGIPTAQQSFLFQTFHQLEAGPQRRYEGTGLGLALTKQLVELHGGTITVNSQVGVGSVFTVRLPNQRLEKEKPLINVTAEGLDRPQGTLSPTEQASESVVGRIVLVEDQEETAGVICDLLTAADYQVIWVIEGSQVVEQVALLKPAAIIINLQLTGVDGRHIIQDLRESLVTGQIKILGLAPEPDSHIGVPGADAILAKPLDPRRLLEQVNALMVPRPTA